MERPTTADESQTADEFDALWPTSEVVEINGAYVAVGDSIPQEVLIGRITRWRADQLGREYEEADLIPPRLVKLVKHFAQRASKGIDRPNRILRPPGNVLDRVSRFVFSAATYRDIFGQMYADMLEEWMAAHAAGERYKAKWIRWRYRGTFVATVLHHLYSSAIAKLIRPFVAGS